jgi:hypothetical protein
MWRASLRWEAARVTVVGVDPEMGTGTSGLHLSSIHNGMYIPWSYMLQFNIFVYIDGGPFIQDKKYTKDVWPSVFTHELLELALLLGALMLI